MEKRHLVRYEQQLKFIIANKNKKYLENQLTKVCECGKVGE